MVSLSASMNPASILRLYMSEAYLALPLAAAAGDVCARFEMRSVYCLRSVLLYCLFTRQTGENKEYMDPTSILEQAVSSICGKRNLFGGASALMVQGSAPGWLSFAKQEVYNARGVRSS